MILLTVIVGLLIGFRPDENNQNILRPTPSGGDSPSAVSEPLAKGAFGSRMKKIPLTKGRVAIVDDEDAPYLEQFNWCFGNGYAQSRMGTLPSPTRMHRVIMNAPEGLEVTTKIGMDWTIAGRI